MHSFQPSRGRILFEVFCALAVVASMVGAWQQTQASALLTAAAAAGLYAMVHLFDLVRHEPVQAAEPQRIDFEPEVQGEPPIMRAVEVPVVALEPQPAIDLAVAEAEIAEPAVPRSSAARRKGGSRKGSGRRAAAPKGAKVAELAPVEETEVVEPAIEVPITGLAPAEPPEVVEAAPPELADDLLPDVPEPAAHVPHAPLFEPEPFVRMQRQAFGRRGRL